MSEKIIVLHPENQPEVDIYPIIKEGSIPNSVIDNQKIKSRTIINSNIALNTLKYEVLHQTLKDLIDSKITQANMENYLTSYYYNVEETQQYVGSEINTLHQTIQNEFYSKTAIDDMLLEKTDLSLFRKYLPGTFLDLDKQQDNQTSKLNIHANGSIFLMNSGNKTNSGNYYLPNSIVKTEDAPNGYYVLSTTNDDYQSLYNLGVYDKITTNSDGTYSIVRQTGYVILDGSEDGWGIYTQGLWAYIKLNNILPVTNQNNVGQLIANIGNVVSITTMINTSSGIQIALGGESVNIRPNVSSINSLDTFKQWLAQNNIAIQYKLATSYTEKVEANHYARYNESFILDHNKSEAERSANLIDIATLSGTTTTQDYFIVTTKDITSILENNGERNYIVSVKLSNVPSNVISAIEIKRNWQYWKGAQITGNGNLIVSFTYEKGYTYQFIIYGNYGSGNGVEYTYTFSDIMLNEGSTSLPYQPYEGKTIHEKDLENSLDTKQDKLVSGTNIKKINGNDILGSGNITLTADSVFTKVEDNVTSLTISKNETYLITTIETYEIYVVGKESINFYGSALVTTTGMLGGNPHININGVSHPLSTNTVTLTSGGLFKAYKLN